MCRLLKHLKLDAVLNATIQRMRAIRVPWMTRVSWLTLAFGRQQKRGLKRGILFYYCVETEHRLRGCAAGGNTTEKTVIINARQHKA